MDAVAEGAEWIIGMRRKFHHGGVCDFREAFAVFVPPHKRDVFQSGSLLPYIPTPGEYKAEEEFAQIKKLSAAGFAQAEADTPDGKLKQAANAQGDLREAAGGAFAPTVEAVREFQENPQNTGAFPKCSILFLKPCSAIRFRKKNPRLFARGFFCRISDFSPDFRIRNRLSRRTRSSSRGRRARSCRRFAGLRRRRAGRILRRR